MTLEVQLTHESTLAELPLDDFIVSAATHGDAVAAVFDERPELPGVIVVDRDTVLGMISREKFLERLSRPYGLELYMRRPIRAMLDASQLAHLELPGDCGIHEAASIALSRPVEQVYEPIVVVLPGERLRLLGIYVLLLAQSRLLALANETIRRQKESADEANSAKSRFLANMSHEIRTPMNGILAMAELLLESEMNGEQREYLEIINTSAEALLTVINDILDFSKIEAGKLDLDCHEFSLRNSLGDMVKPLSLRAHSKGLELGYHVQRNVPDALLGDAGRVRQAIVNLAGNAIKFTERGEVMVHVWLIERGDESCVLQFAVHDTGIGIPRDRQQNVFQPFEQADGSTTRKYGGTGLGLAITVKLVELMGGRVWLESELGRGSTFYFTARFMLQSADAAGDHPVRLSDWPKARVLLVDDNNATRQGLAELLESWRISVTAVESQPAAQQAWQEAVSSGRGFSLAIIDTILSAQSGVVLAEQLARETTNPPLPCILLTSPGHPDHPGRSLTLQRAVYLAKPVKPSDLHRAIDEVLNGVLTPSTSTAASTEDLSRLPPLRVLLAEDGLVNQTVARRLLEKRGHSVVVVGDGREALAAVARDAFDVVLMDIQMPELDGFAATAEIRRREEGAGRRLPIIAMTAHAMKGDRERCLAAGMDGYVSKPIRSRELFAAITESLSRGSKAATAAPDDLPTEVDEDAKVVDWETALDQAAGDRDLVLEMIAVYFEEEPELVSRIRRAIDAGDGPALQRAAHTLRGALDHLAAVRAVGAAQTLETMGKTAALADSTAAYEQLCDELELLELELLDYKESAATSPASNGL